MPNTHLSSREEMFRKFKRKNVVALIFLIFIILSTSTTVYYFNRVRNLKNKAAEPSPLVPTRGSADDLWADVVLGQPDFAQEIPGEIVSFKTAGPGGVTVDRSVRPNRVYIFDGMNSRIVGYSSLGVCSNDNVKACTTDSDCNSASCTIQVGGEQGIKKADIVLGQPNFTTSACNGDGTWLNYPNKAPASASSLCSMPENTFSPYEYGSFSSMVTDSEGNLYTADPF